jgi:hypothetical protein
MKKKFWEKLAVAALLIYCLGLIVKIAQNDNNQWDFWIYYNSARAHALGLNPYDEKVLSELAQGTLRYSFAYPPLTLYFFRPFAMLDYTAAFRLYLSLKCLLLIGLIYWWKREFLQEEAGALFYFFCLAGFNAAIYIDIGAGNISILEQLLMWLAFTFYLKRRWLLFSLFIVLASAFKMVPIVFLALLWFAEEKKKRLYFAGAALGFCFMLFLSYLVSPFLFEEFARDTINRADWERGIVNPSTLACLREAFDLLAGKTGVMVPQIAQRALFVAFAAAVALLTWRAIRIKRDSLISIYLTCLVYALIMPRFKDYSYIILLLPAFFILKKMDVKAWAFILLLPLLYPVNPANGIVPMPGFDIMTKLLREYYTLFMAYGIWTLYLYEAFVLTPRASQPGAPAAVSNHQPMKGAPPWQESANFAP